MADADLHIRVHSKQILEASKRLDKLEQNAMGAEKATNGVSDAFGVLKGAISVAAITAAGVAVAKTADQFQILNARLITATGSQEAATAEFEKLRDLAFEMPGSIEDVTNSFILLTNLGLNPSQQALISYGNTAAAMGKDLSQLIEAVADAATGEFERLKEFGIKSRNEGDQIAFTFRGVTTRVGNSAREIEDFLISLGETEFSGAMAAQNETLGAAFVDLGDSIAVATAKIAGETGFTAAVTDAAKYVSELIRFYSDTEVSGDLIAQSKAIDEQAQKWKEIYEIKKKAAEDAKEDDGIFSFFKPDYEAQAEKAKAQYEALILRAKQIREEAAKLRTDEAAAGAAGGEKAIDYSKGLEKLRNSLKSKTDLLDEALERDQMLIDQAYIDEQISEQEHQSIMTEIHKKASDRRKAVSERENAERLSAVSSLFGNLSSLMNSENKKQFEIGKKAAIAQTVIETYAAAQKAYSALAGIPIVGPVLGIAAAGAAIAAGKVRVDAISSSQFGGGGVSAGAGGGAGVNVPVTSTLPPLPEAPPAAEKPQEVTEERPVQQVNITISGGIHTDEEVRNLIETMNRVNEDTGGAATFTVV